MKHMFKSILFALVVFSLMFSAIGITPVYAITRTVTNANDSGAGSLHQMILDASPGDTITFAPTLSGATIHLASNLTLTKSVTIDGAALASKITISGDTNNDGMGDVRVLWVNSDVTVILNGLIITKGNASAGGGIWNKGTLTITNSTLSDNSASYGGGIYNSLGTLNLINSSLFRNSASYTPGQVGGGIFSAGGWLKITNSTFSANSGSNGYGGGLASYNDLDVTITNSTFSGNNALADGGLYLDSNVINLANNIIANSSGGDCGYMRNGGITTNINNLVEDGSCSAGGVNFKTGDPNLGALADNGGGTQTFALLPGSPAIDAGDDAVCAAVPVNNMSQNGVARPRGAHCDIGSYEYPSPLSTTKEMTGFGLTSPAVTGVINGATITVMVPTGTDVTALVASFTYMGTSVKVGAAPQVSGVTPNNFTSPVTYTVTAADGSTKNYTVRVVIGCISIITSPNDSGAGTLRQAILDSCAGGTIDFAPALSGATIRLASTLALTKNVTIDGSALASKITISGDTTGDGTGDVRIFYTASGVTTTLNSLIITKGMAASNGGGIDNEGGTLAIMNSTISGNSTVTQGGGIYNSGTLTVTNTSLSNNSAAFGGGTWGGGGIYNSGTLTVTNSSFSNNFAAFGGGIKNYNASTATVTNSSLNGNVATYSFGGGIINNGTLTVSGSTLSGNSATDGGGIHNYGTLTVANDTFAGNFTTGVSGYGGGIQNGSGGILTITNSTLSGNTAAYYSGIYNQGTLNYANTIIANSVGGDCSNIGTLETNTNNLVKDGSCAAGGVNFKTGNPNLGGLANNGGSTQTFALLSGSPAIDAGSDAICAAAPVNNLSQNGITRRQGTHCDIGSYEKENPIIPLSVTVNQEANNQRDPASSASTVHFTAVFSRPVSNFTNDKVTVNSPGSPTVTVSQIAPNDGTTFDIVVGNINASGVVTASIDAGRVTDADGNFNDASTSDDNSVTVGIMVTVNQANSQSDPVLTSSATAPTINFTAVFDQPITTFANDAVVVGGTTVSLSGNILPTVVISRVAPTIFNIAITPVAGHYGTITVALRANKVSSASSSLNLNVASSSDDNQVVYDELDTSCDSATTLNSWSVDTYGGWSDVSARHLHYTDDIDLYKFVITRSLQPVASIFVSLDPFGAKNFEVSLYQGCQDGNNWGGSGNKKSSRGRGVGGNSNPASDTLDALQIRYDLRPNELATGGNTYYLAVLRRSGDVENANYDLKVSLYRPNGSASGLPDVDGDAIPDAWEINGYTMDVNGLVTAGNTGNGEFVNLRAMGADSNHKDIFVQIDYMMGHQPIPEAIAKVVTAFANAPVANPNGSTGIKLHVDYGNMIVSPPNKDYTNLGYAFKDGDGYLHYSLKDFQDIRDNPANFSKARARVYHYGLFAHNLKDLGSTSGISRNGDFIVSLGSWNNGVGSVDQQAGTFMHELGHTLGLLHGGDDTTGYKPNFLSVMNYSFQTTGLRFNGQDGLFDYSRFGPDSVLPEFSLPALDEKALFELLGLNGGSAINGYGTKYFCNKNGSLIVKTVDNANNPIDWNCDGSINSAGAQADVNANGYNDDLLTSYDEWANLLYAYSGSAIGLGGALPSYNILNPQAPDQIFSGQTLATDALVSAPFVNSITRVNPSPTGLASVDFLVTFSEPVSGVDASDFTVAATGSITGYGVANVTPAAGPSSNYTVTVNTGTGSGTLRLDLTNNGTIKNVVNLAIGDGYSDGEAYTIAYPTITSIVPNSGTTAGGTSVVVTGTNLTAGTAAFGGVTATCAVNSATQITCTSPPHVAGVVDVVVTTANGSVTSTGGFTYLTVNETLTYSSIAVNDGWVLESTQTSNVGGTKNNTASTFKIGDSATKQQYRSILSFTTILPSTAVITKVTLKVMKSGITGGGNPVKTLLGFVTDIKKGLFGTAALQLTDFQAKPTVSSYAPPMIIAGSWYNLNLTVQKANINKIGVTQIRLRFKKSDDGNNAANYLSLWSGNALLATNRPQLVIEYYVP